MTGSKTVRITADNLAHNWPYLLHKYGADKAHRIADEVRKKGPGDY